MNRGAGQADPGRRGGSNEVAVIRFVARPAFIHEEGGVAGEPAKHADEVGGLASG
jgi:hypothetical protein